MINVIITDDHPIVRSGIKKILEDFDDIQIVDETSKGSELISKILKQDYDLVLLDISLPDRNGLDILKEIKTLKPKQNILVLSIHPEEQYAVRALKLGACGFLNKNSVPQELVSAIRKAAKGIRYISPKQAINMIDQFTDLSDKPLHQSLSDREMEVLVLVAEGLSQKKIAARFSVSPKTISTYQTRVLKKLNLSTISELIRYAIKENLVN